MKGCPDRGGKHILVNPLFHLPTLYARFPASLRIVAVLVFGDCANAGKRNDENEADE